MKVNDFIEINDSEFTFTFARSSGPGGQNVNKVNSKAVLRWVPKDSEGLPAGVRSRFLSKYANRLTNDGAIVLHSQKYRDQGRNIVDAMDRLRDMILDVAVPPVKRRATRPSYGAKQRRLQNKKQKSEKKQNRRRPEMD